jgi:hypothetical protein
MVKQAFVSFAVACSVLLLASCGTNSQPASATATTQRAATPTPSAKVVATPAAAAQTITVHVPGMKDRLNLT